MTLVYNFAESTLNSLGVQMTAVLVLLVFVVPYRPIRAPSRFAIQQRAGELERTDESKSVEDVAFPDFDIIRHSEYLGPEQICSRGKWSKS